MSAILMQGSRCYLSPSNRPEAWERCRSAGTLVAILILHEAFPGRGPVLQAFLVVALLS